MKIGCSVAAGLLLAAGGACAEEQITLRGSAIKALEGLPTVTFVVPWQALKSDAYIAIPPHSMLDDCLVPLDSTLAPAVATPQRDSAEMHSQK